MQQPALRPPSLGGSFHDAVCAVQDGERFWRMPEALIRGNTIKYIRVPEEVMDKVQEESQRVKESGELMCMCSGLRQLRLAHALGQRGHWG